MNRADSANQRLRELYNQERPAFEACRDWAKDHGLLKQLSLPFLVKAQQEYFDAKLKLMVVGQETSGWALHDSRDPQLPGPWENGEDPIDAALNNGMTEWRSDNYDNKGRGFWWLVHRLADHLKAFNPSNPIQPHHPRAFIWTNLLKMDLGRKRAPDEIIKHLASAALVQREIEILQPDIVIFLTGPNLPLGYGFKCTVKVHDGRPTVADPVKAVTFIDNESPHNFSANPSVFYSPKQAWVTYHPAYPKIGRKRLLEALIQKVGPIPRS